MFSLIKIFVSTILILGIGAAIFYFLPSTTKIKGMEVITKFTPESLKEKTEEFLLTPSEHRARIMDKVERELAALRASNDPEETKTAIERTEELIDELRKKNDELSIGEIIKTELIETFLKKEATTTPQCPCGE
jgi:flagellar motility protein MotE (MotC chaperone)